MQCYLRILCLLLVVFVVYGDDKSITKTSGPPSFFIRDKADGLCLAGEVFRRCGIDTLWFVTGKPGFYQIHHRLVDDTDLDSCLDKYGLKTHPTYVKWIHLFAKYHNKTEHIAIWRPPQPVCPIAIIVEPRNGTYLVTTKTVPCTCADQAASFECLCSLSEGYYITQDKERYCLSRDGRLAVMVICDSAPGRFSVQFATKHDIALLGSDGARFVRAASDGDMDVVAALLMRRVSPNVRDWERRTPALAAAASGNLLMLEYLVRKGADIALTDKDDVTALIEAVIGGHIDVIRYLLSREDISKMLDFPAASGATPLWFAAAEGRDEIALLLIHAGADVNKERADGISALIAASAGGHVNTALHLLDAGADATHRTEAEGLTALLAACENGSLPIVSALVQRGVESNTISNAGFSPLIVAAANGHADIVEYLLTHGNADPDMPHPENISALMYASAGGHADVVRILLSHGPSGKKAADIHRRHKLGGTALLEAATKGSLEVYSLLLSHGADDTVTDRDGVTVLMTASSHGREELVSFILDTHSEPFDIDQLSHSGGTALMYAAGGGHVDTCRLLVRTGGADIDARVKASPSYLSRINAAKFRGPEGTPNPTSSMIEISEVEHSDGGTALTVASEGGFTEVVRLLVELGSNLNIVAEDSFTALTYAISAGHEDTAIFLLEHGADPNSGYVGTDNITHNILYDAISRANETLAVVLIDKGADLSYRHVDGTDILTLASSVGSVSVVQAIIEKSGSVCVGSTLPLIAAASEGNLGVMKVLIERGGCDANDLDVDGSNSLMAACARGQKEVVEYLLEQKLVTDINAQNIDGHTALMFASNGVTQVLQIFDKMKNYLNNEGEETDRLIREAISIYEDVIDLLVEYGADRDLKDNEGHVASDFMPLSHPENGIEIEATRFIKSQKDL